MSKLKIIISWLLVIIWMIVIFAFSNMDADNSNKQSMGLIDKTVETTTNITNNVGITDIKDKEIEKITEDLNFPVRKLAHMFCYFVLATLVINALKSSGINNRIMIITIVICFIYSCLDEYHQTFINDRSGKFTDCLIDMIGSIFAVIIYKIIGKFGKKCKI